MEIAINKIYNLLYAPNQTITTNEKIGAIILGVFPLVVASIYFF